MTPWDEIEEFYIMCTKPEAFKETGTHMLDVVHMLKNSIDLNRYGVGTSMFKLAIWRKGDSQHERSSGEIQLIWTPEQGYIISADRFCEHRHSVDLSDLPKELDVFLNNLEL